MAPRILLLALATLMFVGIWSAPDRRTPRLTALARPAVAAEPLDRPAQPGGTVVSVTERAAPTLPPEVALGEYRVVDTQGNVATVIVTEADLSARPAGTPVRRNFYEVEQNGRTLYFIRVEAGPELAPNHDRRANRKFDFTGYIDSVSRETHSVIR